VILIAGDTQLCFGKDVGTSVMRLRCALAEIRQGKLSEFVRITKPARACQLY
jgi:hypothetical protein